MFRLTVLASGSSGNCALVTTPAGHVLVDMGLSGKQVGLRLQAMGVQITDLSGVLLTHEHGDHTLGLKALAGKHHLPIFSNEPTRLALEGKVPGYAGWNIFETGVEFELNDLRVQSFPVPHDAYEPVGFVLQWRGRKVVFLTDLGHATKLLLQRCHGCDAVVLEANYDEELLRLDTKRPWAVKQRIHARHGHLSNSAAAEVAVSIASERLQHVLLGHLSADCNRPELAFEVVRSRLVEHGWGAVQVHATSPDHASDPILLSPLED